MAELTRRQQAFQVLVDLLDLRPAGAPRPQSLRLGVIPGTNGPRYLIALGHRRAAAASCLTYQGMRSPKIRLGRGAMGLALRAGLGRRVTTDEYTADLGPGSLLDHLSRLLGEPHLVPFIGVSNLDAVWKPTLQLYGPDGTPLAFVKIGIGPVPRVLVTTEIATLSRWAAHPDPRLVVPDLIAGTAWRDHPIAVIAPLPLDARRLHEGAMAADPVRRLDGPIEQGGLVDAPWWTGRREVFADHKRIDALLGTIEARHDEAEHTWARWHGDWVPWNLARCHRGLVAWDWEYSEPGAPVGLDETHLAFQDVRVYRGGTALDAFAAARRAAPSEWVADAHVAMVATRSGDLARHTGVVPPDQAELLAAAEAVIS